MTQLEFCREHDATAIARAEATEPATIPTIGDRATFPARKTIPSTSKSPDAIFTTTSRGFSRL